MHFEGGDALPAFRARALLPRLQAVCPRIVGIAARFGYRIYDSLIIASALEAACATLYSEDMQDGQVIEGRLTIRNPFGP